MLVIKVELWPYGVALHEERLQLLSIENDGSHPLRPEYGNYNCTFTNKLTNEAVTVTVKNWKRDEDVWGLVKMAIDTYLEEKHKR